LWLLLLVVMLLLTLVSDGFGLILLSLDVLELSELGDMRE